MKKKNKKNKAFRWIIPLVIFFALLTIFIILVVQAEDPPIAEIEKAKAAITEAGSINAELYSPVKFPDKAAVPKAELLTAPIFICKEPAPNPVLKFPVFTTPELYPAKTLCLA